MAMIADTSFPTDQMRSQKKVEECCFSVQHALYSQYSSYRLS